MEDERTDRGKSRYREGQRHRWQCSHRVRLMLRDSLLGNQMHGWGHTQGHGPEWRTTMED